jgi:citronellyl-CoA dehydrogenase
MCVRIVLMSLERCLQLTMDYTRERKAFGRCILDNQSVHFRLAELETELELLRSLLHRTISKWVKSSMSYVAHCNHPGFAGFSRIS